MSKYQGINSNINTNKNYVMKNNFSEELILNQGSDLDDILQQKSIIHQGGDEINNTFNNTFNSTYTKKYIPVLQKNSHHNSERDTLNVTEDSIQDTGSFYNKPRMAGEHTARVPKRSSNNNSPFKNVKSSQHQVAPLLIPTKDLTKNNGNYAIARRHKI